MYPPHVPAAALILAAAGMTDAAIADVLGISRETVRRWRRRLGGR